MEISKEDRVFAGLSHLGIIFGLLGMLAALVIWLAKKDADFVRFHAKQAFFYQLIALIILNVTTIAVIGGFAGIGTMMGQRILAAGPRIYVIALLSLTAILYGVVGAVKAFMGKDFRYVIIGDTVEKLK